MSKPALHQVLRVLTLLSFCVAIYLMFPQKQLSWWFLAYIAPTVGFFWLYCLSILHLNKKDKQAAYTMGDRFRRKVA